MKTKPKRQRPKSAARNRTLPPPISASKVLRAEAARLNVLREAMPNKAQRVVQIEMFAFCLAAAFLDSLGAPERLVRYTPVPPPKDQR